ncbi:MAG: hypothetical protein ACPGWR_06075 [Ardenticatenaceae bacterium]
MINKYISPRFLLALLSILVPMWLIENMPADSAFGAVDLSPWLVLMAVFSSLTLSLITARL